MSHDEDQPMASIDLHPDDYIGGYRIWPATAPLIDTTGGVPGGTHGYHVHAWLTTEDFHAGRAAVNQTFAAVTINGIRLDDYLVITKQLTCPEHGHRCAGATCCCHDLHRKPSDFIVLKDVGIGDSPPKVLPGCDPTDPACQANLC